MRNKLLLISIIIIGISVFALTMGEGRLAYADDFSDVIRDEADKLDLNELEDFFNEKAPSGFDFIGAFKNVLNGKYDGAENFFGYIKNVIFSEARSLLPTFVSIVLIVLICGILSGLKVAALSENVALLVRFAALISVSLLLSREIISIYNSTENIIKNIGIFSEIMSPIIITLMIAANGNASASVYKPSVVFFSDFVIGIFYKIVLPIIAVMLIFVFVSHLSKDIRIKKFSEFFAWLLKWIFGTIVFCYGFIVSVQGLTVSTIDGISVKVAKYAILNSVPIVGGLIKDGLDMVTAGSVVIKNALGLAGLTGLFYLLLAPLIHIITFSLLLKLASAVTDVISDGTVSDFMGSLAKTISYFVATILTVSLMAFILTLLMVFSANSVF